MQVTVLIPVSCGRRFRLNVALGALEVRVFR